MWDDRWDDEVDVVCTGAGLATMATAVAAFDCGLDVFVARAGAEDQTLRAIERWQSWIGTEISNRDTSRYLASLFTDLGAFGENPRETELSIRSATELPPVDVRSAVEPFVGARMREWATRCLATPYGFLFSRFGGPSTAMRTGDGEVIEVAAIGTIERTDELVAENAVADWLSAQLREREMTVAERTPLTRIVFEEGEAVGAVFATPRGPYAVRARHGLTISPSGPSAVTGSAVYAPEHPGPLQVSLVGQSTSRFGRLELLSTSSTAPANRVVCGAVNRGLHGNLHDARASRSQPWRCRKVHGHPPFGQ